VQSVILNELTRDKLRVPLHEGLVYLFAVCLFEEQQKLVGECLGVLDWK
jgi:hypothetical protein